MELETLLKLATFKVGDIVYYRSPESRYAIRKSPVVKVEERHRRIDRNIFIPYDVLTLENGIVVNASAAFATRQEAENYLIEELKSKLLFQQVALENLKQEIDYEKRTLKRLEQRQH